MVVDNARNRKRAEARKGRMCETCNQPIPGTRRKQARFCSKKCQRTHPRMRAYQCDTNRKRLYGITRSQWAAILDAQGMGCAICGTTEPGGKGSWHVDHDHATGEVRGLLCHFCNIMLGNAHDEIVRLRAAVAYLERHRSMG